MRLSISTFLLLFLSVTILSSQWTQISSMPEDFRSHHSFGFGIDGTGYIVTGTTAPDDNFSKSFYSYDPVADEWTQKDDFPGAARGFGIGEVYNGKAYFGFGISNVPLADLWVYDPVTDEWTQLPSCPGTPRFHPALTITNDKLIVGMGGSANGNLKDFWMYDIVTQEWNQIADLPSVVRHHPYQFSIGDYHYAGFGHGQSIYSEWYRYDSATDVWDEMASLPAEGRVAGTQFAYGGKGYILSGDGMDHSSMETGEFWEYDPIADSWTELPEHPSTSRWAPSSFVIDNKVYLINGQTLVPDLGYQYVDEAYSYELSPPVSTEEGDVSFEVYPNPATDFIQVEYRGETNNVSIEITDITGKTLHTQSTTEAINISGFPIGTYVIEFKIGDRSGVKKFTKM